MNPWIWRLIIVVLAVALMPVIVSGTATLIANGIQAVGQGIHSLFKPLSMSGDARLEGLIRLCLYLISITLLVRFLFGRGDRDGS
jgi:hypothetical protein